MKFQIYELKDCGFYDKETNKLRFGAMNSWWNDFITWSGSNTFFNTQTFRCKDSENPSVYCLCSGTYNSIWYLSLWNETSSINGSVLSIPKEGTVNDISPVKNSLKKDTVPGWESNFIIDPAKRYFISLSLNNNLNGKGLGIWQLERYFLNYLRNFSKYRTIKEKKGGLIHVGYNSADELPEEPVEGRKRTFDIRFKCARVILPDNISYIRENVSRIRTLVYRTKVDFKNPDQMGKIKKFMALLGVVSTNDFESTETTRTFLSEIPWEPTLDDLDNTYNAWHTSDDNDEMGIKLAGDASKIVWFDKTFAKDEFSLPNDLESLQTIKKDDFVKIWSEAENAIKGKYIV